MSDDRAHWENAYAERSPERVSWFEPRPQRSLELIQSTGVGPEAGILDVGGGASGLAAQLLDIGYKDLTVADISAGALAHARAQLGSAAAKVSWIEADIRAHDFGRQFDLWHDRAVFHFMVSAADREGYLDVLRRTLRPGGQLVVATFGPQGPKQCSGLAVQPYSAEELHQVLGEDFQLVASSLLTHRTPSGSSQQFLYAHFRLRPAGS